jgi:hypothetical protein
VQIRRLTVAAVAGFAVLGLAACRTAPNVAAYVGDEQVTVSELDAAVDQRLDDPDVAAFAKGKRDDFTRQVLSALVQREVFSAAAQRYGVQVGDGEVRARITELLDGRDADQEYASAAQQGLSRADILENVRDQLLAQKIAVAEGKGDALSDSALKAAYTDERASLAKPSFGYITVPDQATADAVLAQLTADPRLYGAVAAQHPGTYTLPTLEARSSEQIPPVLADGIKAARPGTGFTTPVEGAGVVVTFVGKPEYPSFAEVRPELEQQAAVGVQQAGAELVAKVRKEIGIRVNPRYRKLDADTGVVDILGGGDAAAG